MTRTKAIFLIVVLVFLTYSNSLFNGFYGDAQGLFTNNNFYKHSENLKLLFSKELVTTNQQLEAVFSLDELSFSGMISYRPLTALSFFTDYFLWRDNPAGYHLSDVLLHLATCILVYLFVFELTGLTMAALGTALLFATHPVHSEVLNSIAYRSDILAALFALVSFLTFIYYRRKGKTYWFIVTCLAFILSVLAKESAIFLPILIWLYDQFFLTKNSTKRNILVWPAFGLIMAGYLYIYLIVIGNSFYPKFPRMTDPSLQAMTALKNFIIYMAALIVPFKTTVLPPVYTLSIAGMSVLEVVFGLSMIVLLVWLAVKSWRCNKIIAFSVLWFFIAYLPVSNAVTILPNPVAFRFLYFPSIGFFILLSVLIYQALKRFKKEKHFSFVLAICIVINMGVTIPLNAFFKSSVTAAKEMIYNYPDSSRPYWNLAFLYFQQGKLKEAEKYLQRYWETDGRNPTVLSAQKDPSVYLLFSRCEQENHRRAIVFLNAAINLKPDYAVAYVDLAKRYILVEEYQKALDSALTVLKLRPGTAMGYIYAIHSEIMLGKTADAEKLWQEASALTPQDPSLKYLKHLLEEKKSHAQ